MPDDFQIRPGRIRGPQDKEKLLELEIVTGKRNASFYANLSKGMDYYQIKKMTELAMQAENFPAIKGLAASNQYAVSEALSSNEGLKLLGRRASTGDSTAPELFFLLRNTLSEQTKPIFRRLARRAILKVAHGILGRGIHGAIYTRTEYTPDAVDFDLDETIENYLERGYLTYDEIVALEKRERSKNAVLIFDTSGSLYGKSFITAALAVAVLAYNLAHDNFSVILFNTKAYVVKHVNEKIRIEKVIDRILDSESAGYTNISDALRVAATEIQKMRTRNKFVVLVSDGSMNRGGDPRPLVRKIPKLHTLTLPSKHAWGERVMKDLARLGKGRHLKVRSYEEIPQALSKLMRET